MNKDNIVPNRINKELNAIKRKAERGIHDEKVIDKTAENIYRKEISKSAFYLDNGIFMGEIE